MNAPKIGLDNVYIAKMVAGSDDGGAPSWDTPVKLSSGVVKMTGNPNGALVTDWGDNGPFFVTNSRGNLQAQLEMQDIDPTILAELLGQSRANGVTVEGALDQSPWYALGFRVWIGGSDDSGNKIYEYFWYLKGKFAIPQQGAETKKAQITPQHTTLMAEFAKLYYNDMISSHARSDSPEVSSTTISSWFNAPVYQTTVNLSAVTVVMAKSTTKLTFTFAKADASTFKMAEQTAVIGSSILVVEAGAAKTGALVWTGEGTSSVVATFTPDVAFGADTVTATCTAAVKDVNGVAVTPLSTDIDFS